MSRHVVHGFAASTDVRTVRMALAAKGVASDHVPVDIRQDANRTDARGGDAVRRRAQPETRVGRHPTAPELCRDGAIGGPGRSARGHQPGLILPRLWALWIGMWGD